MKDIDKAFTIDQLQEHRKNDGDHEQLLRLISERVAHLLMTNKDLLFSSLYRLDIDEKIIQDCLFEKNPSQCLGRAIYKRQMARIKAKKNTSVGNSTDNPDLEW